VNDAYSVRGVLERHADGTVNFATPKVLVGTSDEQPVTKEEIKYAVRNLFVDDAEVALFYFAGHGYTEETGGYLCGTDSRTGDDGFSIAELMILVGRSPAKSKIIIIDACHSGIAGARSDAPTTTEIADGTIILTASTANQSAFEVPEGGAGVFTNLLVDALEGAAANLVGDITPGSVYAHIDQSLGPWGGQRPVFKTNVKNFVSIRKATPPISLPDLLALATHFPSDDYTFPLDPSFEPHRSAEDKANPEIPPPDPKNTATFAVLQNYVKVNLVRPVDAPHMWHAAMQAKSCELTVLGQHYRRLVAEGLI
jgi:hypothetical protein